MTINVINQEINNNLNKIKLLEKQIELIKYVKPIKPIKPKLVLLEDKPLNNSNDNFYYFLLFYTLTGLPIIYILYKGEVNLTLAFTLITLGYVIFFLIKWYLSYVDFKNNIRIFNEKNEIIKNCYNNELNDYYKNLEVYEQDFIIYEKKKNQSINLSNEIDSLNKLISSLRVKKEKLTVKIISPLFNQNSKFETWKELVSLLNLSSIEELIILNKILKNSYHKSSVELINQIKDIAQPKFDKSDSFTYKQMLVNIGNHLKIVTIGKSVLELEADICQKQFKSVIDKLTPLQKQQLEKELLNHSQSKGFGKEIGSLAALTGAQLSGFGIYMAASTVVGGITSAIGVTLPFAFYTGMSSFISTIIGPVGWIGLAGFALYKYNKVNYEKVIPSIIYIIALKYKLLNGK